MNINEGISEDLNVKGCKDSPEALSKLMQSDEKATEKFIQILRVINNKKQGKTSYKIPDFIYERNFKKIHKKSSVYIFADFLEEMKDEMKRNEFLKDLEDFIFPHINQKSKEIIDGIADRFKIEEVHQYIDMLRGAALAVLENKKENIIEGLGLSKGEATFIAIMIVFAILAG